MAFSTVCTSPPRLLHRPTSMLGCNNGGGIFSKVKVVGLKEHRNTETVIFGFSWQVLKSKVVNWVFAFRLVQWFWLGWVFETQERKKERKNSCLPCDLRQRNIFTEIILLIKPHMHICPCPWAVGISEKIWNQTYFEPMTGDSVEIFHHFAFWRDPNLPAFYCT